MHDVIPIRTLTKPAPEPSDRTGECPQKELERFREETTLIVHDLKNPLGVILANVSSLESERFDEADRKEIVADIRGAAEQASRLVANLLDLTRFESNQGTGRRTATNLSLILRGVLERRRYAARQRRIALSFQNLCECVVEADVDLLARVLDNILDNAFRYTPAGGRIEIKSSVHGDRVRIEIGNTGPAIPAEHRERVFAKFGQCGANTFRVNHGLGLYFCRLAIEAHGGSIRVESAEGLPAVFVVELPGEFHSPEKADEGRAP